MQQNAPQSPELLIRLRPGRVENVQLSKVVAAFTLGRLVMCYLYCIVQNGIV
jgi:hypothetical protein